MSLSHQDVRRNQRLGLPNQRAAAKAKRGRVAHASATLDSEDDGLDEALSYSDEDYEEDVGVDDGEFVAPTDSGKLLLTEAAEWKETPRAKKKRSTMKRPSAGLRRRGVQQLALEEMQQAAELWVRGFKVHCDGPKECTSLLMSKLEALPLDSFLPSDDDEEDGMGDRTASSVAFEALYNVPPSSSTRATQQQAAPVEEIPYDCWNIIASYMKPLSLLCLAATSSYYRTVLEGCEAGWPAVWDEIVVTPLIKSSNAPTGSADTTHEPWIDFELLEIVTQHPETGEDVPNIVKWFFTKAVSVTKGAPKITKQFLTPHESTIVGYAADSEAHVPPLLSRKYPWSFYYSLRHVMVSTMLNMQLRSVLKPLNQSPSWYLSTSHRSLLQCVVDTLQEELNELEISAYLDLFQRAEGNPAVQDFARIHINRCRGMYNVAAEMAAKFDATRLSAKVARALRAPSNEAEWKQLVSSLTILGLSSDLSLEKDVTRLLTAESTFVPRVEAKKAYTECHVEEHMVSSPNRPKHKAIPGQRAFKRGRWLKVCPALTGSEKRYVTQLCNNASVDQSNPPPSWPPAVCLVRKRKMKFRRWGWWY